MDNVAEVISMEDSIHAIAFGTYTTVPPAQLATIGQQQVFPEKVKGVHRRWIQNVGTNAIKYWIVATNNPGAGVAPAAPDYINQAPHGVIPGGAVNYDGLGGLLDLSGFGGAVFIDAGDVPGNAILALICVSYNAEYRFPSSGSNQCSVR